MKKIFCLRFCLVMGLFIALISEVKAADIEAVLEENAGLSAFVVKDSDNTQVFGVSSDGDVTLVDTAATVDPWIGLGASAAKIEFDDQTTDEINLLNCNVGIGTTAPGQKLTVDGTFGILEGGTNPSFHTIFQGGDQTGDITYTFPIAQGGANTYLQNNGFGVLSWAAAGGASTSEAYVTIGNTANLSAERALTGTANQITVTDNGANSTVVLSTPQDIHTAATPQFARLGLGAAADGTNILTATSTSTTNLSKALNVTHTGAITGTGYAGYFSKTGISTTNVGLYATASGATNNYAAIFEAGNVGIGTTGPQAKLEVAGVIKMKGLDSTVYTAGGPNAASVILSNLNTWGDFPDLSITFTLSEPTTVMAHYEIAMDGGVASSHAACGRWHYCQPLDYWKYRLLE